MAIVYTRNEERANYITHFAGIIVILSASSFFLFDINSVENTYMYLTGFLLYAFGAVSSYLSSGLYHCSRSSSIWRERLRKLDHAAIYWHIAGSYSPITLVGMCENQNWGLALFVIVWLCAILGTVTSFRNLKEHSNLETICFVSMGFTLLIAFDVVVDCIGWKSMYYIFAEGAAFVIGAIFYSFNNVRYMHTVFHVFVLLGSVFHIMALYYMLY